MQRAERVLVVVGTVNTLATVVAIISGASAAALWYMDLFYGQTWFRNLAPDQQAALRGFIDRLVGPAVWPLVATNTVWVAVYAATMIARRRAQKSGGRT